MGKLSAWSDVNPQAWWQVIINRQEWYVEASESNDHVIAVYWCDAWIEEDDD